MCQTIKPAELSCMYRLTKDTCYKRKTGKCSLDIPFFGERCQNLYADILENGVLRPVVLGKNRCGHYDFTDGQHRTCIAQMRDLEIPAEIVKESPYDCQHCSYKRASLIYRIQSWFDRSWIIVRTGKRHGK